ncbi:methionyl-tRNA formyltransferase-like protein [Lichenibacterium dinghuense]|uniref:methionyl-tRNA formyltransferase-like protein n=1 Tax=Lichenibacterium dinghuense TaxID=2895977 RepID=UPI001F425241|nr:methionyl-tRNA formyltransferase-like protein [Lichenibacterium sp. 6Y81]
MDELSEVVARATEAVDAGYVRLRIDGGRPAYRERVYCYELYHQMRTVWPRECPYTLNGEVDKRAHPIMADLGLGQVPDLLVHRPGSMAGNHAIIEVKHGGGSTAGFAKDLETLSGFRHRARYRRAILLVYATSGRPGLLGTIEALYDLMDEPAEVEVWFHRRAGEAARRECVLAPDGGSGPWPRSPPRGARKA